MPTGKGTIRPGESLVSTWLCLILTINCAEMHEFLSKNALNLKSFEPQRRKGRKVNRIITFKMTTLNLNLYGEIS